MRPGERAAPERARPDDRAPATRARRSSGAPAAPQAQAPVVIASPNAGVVALRVAFAAGSADDPAGKEGLTKLVATTMAEGGTQSATYAELVEKLYPFAASIGAHVDRDETVFTVTVAASSIADVYPLFRDVILAPRFDDGSFARLKSRQTSALTSGLPGRERRGARQGGARVGALRRAPYGTPRNRHRARARVDDARRRRGAVRARFCKERALVGVAGALPDGFEKTVEGDMAKLPPCAGNRAPLPRRRRAAACSSSSSTSRARNRARSRSASPRRSRAATRREFPGLLLATDILGLHESSRGSLVDQLRQERGLNYGDYAYAEFFEQDGYTRVQQTNDASPAVRVDVAAPREAREHGVRDPRGALRLHEARERRRHADDFERQRGFVSRLEGLQAQTMSRRLGYAMDDRTYGLDGAYLDVVRKGWSQLDAPKLNALMKKLLGTKDLAIVVVTSDGQKPPTRS